MMHPRASLILYPRLRGPTVRSAAPATGQRIMPHVTHRRQRDLAHAIQHQQHPAAHDVTQSAVGLSPFPCLT